MIDNEIILWAVSLVIVYALAYLLVSSLLLIFRASWSILKAVLKGVAIALVLQILFEFPEWSWLWQTIRSFS